MTPATRSRRAARAAADRREAVARAEVVRRARAGETVLVVDSSPHSRRALVQDLRALAPETAVRLAGGLEALRFPSGGCVRLVSDCRSFRADAVVGPSTADGIRFLVDIHGAAYLGATL